MADIAFIFHWSPSEMDVMSPGELMTWHRLAVDRANAKAKATKG